ncbi:MAG: glycosyltransferase family 4 protein [Patescibacteria group bacterium]|jgi:glycosyltransferase involved in cell wall biosynthesis
MKAAFYTPYLETLGGGEKYLFDIARVLHENKYDCVFLWHDVEIKKHVLDRFGQEYDFIGIDTEWQSSSLLSKIARTRKYDVVFFHSDGSYFFSLAKKNFVILQAPTARLLPVSLFNKLKSQKFKPVYYDNFVKHFFEKKKLTDKQYILNPAVSDEYFSLPKNNKEKMILSVGRFFGHLHSKKQEILIKAFSQAQRNHKEFREYSLILAGSCRPEDHKYLESLKKLSQDNSKIQIFENISFAELKELYAKSTFYWHAAGYGENELLEPEKMEHFGISIIESMAAGCVPLAYNGGGPKEIILHGNSGYLYDKKTELVTYTKKLISDPKLRTMFAEKSVLRAREKYSFKVFSQNVMRMVK